MGTKIMENRMKSEWNQVTVEDLMRMKGIEELQRATEDEKNLKVAALLGNISYEDILKLPLADLKPYMDNTEFIYEKPKPKKARKKYEINGRMYRLLKDPTEMSVAQYMDYQAIQADGFEKRPADLLAIMLVPEGHEYNDGYDKDEVLEDMLSLGVEEALGVADFFIRRFGRFLNLMRTLLPMMLKWKRIRANKEDKELLKAAEVQIRAIMDELMALYGSHV